VPTTAPRRSTVATAGADRESLAEMMVGHKVARPRVEHLEPGSPVVELAGVTATGAAGARLLDGVTLTVREREIVGLAGVAGNGQSALAALLSGTLAPDAGDVRIDGETIARFSARDFIARRVGRIPEDRHATGVVGDMAVWENLIAEQLREPPFWRWGRIIDFAACRAYARRLVEQFDIRGAGIDGTTRLLSGGNMQKLILARTLDRSPRFILASQPIRGLDEGAIAAVHQRLLDAKRAGAGVLVISEDLDEILGIADRVVVIHGGRVSAPLDVGAVDARRLGLMMTGDLSHGEGVAA
jgi:simple sugar transport system ATP-binding protein